MRFIKLVGNGIWDGFVAFFSEMAETFEDFVDCIQNLDKFSGWVKFSEFITPHLIMPIVFLAIWSVFVNPVIFGLGFLLGLLMIMILIQFIGISKEV